MGKPTFTMMCGLPGSGKSYFASEYSKTDNSIVYSSDKVREELCGDENLQDNNEEVFKVLHKRIKDSLRTGKSVIYDATNINSKRRRAFLSELRNISCLKKCVIIATQYEKCLEQNEERERNVPKEVITRMYLNWNTPYYFEGWDDISIQFNNEIKNLIYSFLFNNRNFNQNNPHHTMTLSKHCKSVSNAFSENTILFYAGIIHDCGKPFTKTFVNCKGERTDIAHYYNHQNCGAYDSLFFAYGDDIDPLDISVLVNLHMQPYFWEKDKENGNKTREKLKRIWGNKLYNDVMALHMADVEAH